MQLFTVICRLLTNAHSGASGHPCLAAARPEVWLSVFGAFVTCFDLSFSHALAVELNAVGVVNEAVENSICESGLTDHVMPCVDG